MWLNNKAAYCTSVRSCCSSGICGYDKQNPMKMTLFSRLKWCVFFFLLTNQRYIFYCYKIYKMYVFISGEISHFQCATLSKASKFWIKLVFYFVLVFWAIINNDTHSFTYFILFSSTKLQFMYLGQSCKMLLLLLLLFLLLLYYTWLFNI